MYSPLNIVNMYDQLIRNDQKYVNYTKVIKDKFNLSTDMLNLIDLIPIEDIIAYKIEKSLQSFNGRMLFPLKSLYMSIIDIAYNKVIDSYEDTKLRQSIRQTFNGIRHTVGYIARKELSNIDKLKNA